MKKVLVLGAGLVAKPLVEYLLKENIHVTIGCNTCGNAERMINGHPNGTFLKREAENKTLLEDLVKASDLVVSLLPYRFHPEVAEICIRLGRHLVTTSYVSDRMFELDADARKKGVLLLNEIGLDPGIDHMSAMRIIDHIHSRHGKVIKFFSLCGALPAPGFDDNPFRYKFSWSPKGVILASKNEALYLVDGKDVKVESADLFKVRFDYDFPGVGNLEVYPNRNSKEYIDIYNIPEVKTIFRGTFRFPGWCEILDAIKSIDMLSENVSDYSGVTWSGFIGSLLPEDKGSLAERLGKQFGSKWKLVYNAFEWLEMTGESDMGYGKSSPFEILSDRMIKKMMLGNDEKDMIVLRHLFLAEYPGRNREVIASGMVDYGSPSSNTSIARTVGLPAAIASKMILDGKISLTGVYRPVVPEIYHPVLEELEKMGIILNDEYGLPESAMISDIRS